MVRRRLARFALWVLLVAALIAGLADLLLQPVDVGRPIGIVTLLAAVILIGFLMATRMEGR